MYSQVDLAHKAHRYPPFHHWRTLSLTGSTSRRSTVGTATGRSANSESPPITLLNLRSPLPLSVFFPRLKKLQPPVVCLLDHASMWSWHGHTQCGCENRRSSSFDNLWYHHCVRTKTKTFAFLSSAGLASRMSSMNSSVDSLEWNFRGIRQQLSRLCVYFESAASINDVQHVSPMSHMLFAS